MNAKILLSLYIALIGFVLCGANGEPGFATTNTIRFPLVTPGGGERFGGSAVTNFFPNSYPYTRIGGEREADEFQAYLSTVIWDRKCIPEILPVAQDTNGNWGIVVDEMQLSLRFNSSKFTTGQMVPARIILRNCSAKARSWLRNALPDNGYTFTLKHGTNCVAWSRPPAEPVYGMTDPGSMNEGDPYRYVAEPHAEGLTVVYLNRFYDLSRPGQYSLQVQIAVPRMDGQGVTNIVSGTAAFEIVPKVLR